MTEISRSPFAPEVVAAIARHMNEDHSADSVLICRALGGQPGTTAATMTGLDAAGIQFAVTTPAGPADTTVPWSETVTERSQVRAEVVRMYHDACTALGVEPRPPADH